MAFHPPLGRLPMPLLPTFTGPSHHPDPEIANPNCNDIMNCVVCGGICVPTVPNALGRHVNERSWMHPWLVKAENGFLKRRVDPQTAKESRFQEPDPVRLFQVWRFRGGGSGFDLQEGGSVSVDTRHSAMYIPIHRVCFDLAERFCRFRSSSDLHFTKFSRGSNEYGIPSRIGQFYEIWMQRAWMARQWSRGVLQLPIEESSNYLCCLFTIHLNTYKAYVDHCKPWTPVQEANPSGNKMITTPIILKHLLRLPRHFSMPSPAYQGVRHRVTESLPVEIQDMITEKLKPFYYLNREQLVCTRILPSKWWMEELLSGRLIPWLFDIDERYLFKVDKKFRAETPGEPFNIIRDLDWELLCRQLGQNDLFEPGGILHGEKELENRWRIWRLLDRAVFVPNLPDGPRS